MPGDYVELARLAGKLGQFANGRAQASLAKAISQEAVTQAQLSFRESRDPYGTAWAPLKHRKGKPLLLTGRLRASISVQAISPTSFRIGTNVRYAVFHQKGVDKTFKRKPRTQAMLRHASGRRAGQFAKLTTKIHGSRLTGDVLHFDARDMHLVIPKRQFIPEGNLGPIWAKAFVAAGNLAISRILGSG